MWMSTKELAKYLGVSVAYLNKNRREADTKEAIPYCRLGRSIKYNTEVVDDFLKNNMVTGTTENTNERLQ